MKYVKCAAIDSFMMERLTPLPAGASLPDAIAYTMLMLASGNGNDNTDSQVVLGSVAVLAEIPLRSPQKLFIFIIKKIICWVNVSKNKII